MEEPKFFSPIPVSPSGGTCVFHDVDIPATGALFMRRPIGIQAPKSTEGW
jgi:hypothetical protein